MAENYLELVDLQARIRAGLESLFPGKAWVKAEISQYSPRANGHCYLSLSQTRGGKTVAECRAMIWKWHFPTISAFFQKATGETLRPGITVLVRCEVNYSELYGLTLYIDAIDPAFTVGEKVLEKKKAIEKLTAGGYMEKQKELLLPRLPYRLAVISSKTAAGYEDFCRHIEENEGGYRFEVHLFEALMQGSDAPASIIDALDRVGEGFDAVLILRGGGSETDLACFDDYDLAVAIATCPVPVITAIGHERDYHIADMVASRYVKTPTALAALFVDIYAVEEEYLVSLGTRIRLSLTALAGERIRETDALDRRIRFGLLHLHTAALRRVDSTADRIHTGLLGLYSASEKKLSDARLRLERNLRAMTAVPERALSAAVGRVRFAAMARHGAAWSWIALQEALIKASDPRALLERGYVVVTGRDNKILKSVDRVRVGDCIGVRFSDGTLTARVDNVMSDSDEINRINTA